MSKTICGMALAALVLCFATGARGAVVTYTLSLNDDGSGAFSAPGSFAIYAQASQGDNAGLFAFGVDLVDGSIDSFMNLAPIWLYRKTTAPVAPNKFAGFGAGVSEDVAAGKISGVTDLAKQPNLIPVYGFGQENIDMNAFTPGGPRPTGYNLSLDQNPNTPGPLVAAKMLLGIGTYSPGQHPAFQTGSVDNKVSVYVDRTGTANTIATLVINSICAAAAGAEGATGKVTLTCEPPFPYVALDAVASKGNNQAVGGSIAVTGSNGNYVSEVDQLLDPSTDVGNAPIATIGNEPGAIYVMAKLSGSAADVANLLGQMSNDVDGSDSQFAVLHAKYDAAFGGGGFNALFKFDNSGNRSINWDLTGSGVTVDQLAAVPEPGGKMVGFLAGLMLLGRRRLAVWSAGARGAV